MVRCKALTFALSLVILSVSGISMVDGNVVEPTCLSRWDYEYKTMQHLLKLENNDSQMKDAAVKMQEMLTGMSEGFEKLKNQVTPKTTYTRWGRTVCPSTASLVYKGYAAGKHHNQPGSGSDTLCLPEHPTWRKYEDGNTACCRGYIYGSEIDIKEPSNIFPYPVNEQNNPCVVCLTHRATTLMIPAQTDCPSGWTKEFGGYLMAAYHSHPGPHNHICVDSEPEFVPNGGKNENEHILYLVEAQCGSLPCPPYVHGRELACVVCSI